MAGCSFVACGHRPRRPRNAVPVVPYVSWWAYQDALHITALEPTVLDSHLNLFNSEALISLHITGTAAYPRGRWKPYVKSVHVAERFTPESTDASRIAEITFTPVIGVREDTAYQGQPESFSIVVEHTLHSFAWGPNHFILRAGGLHSELTLYHPK